MQVALEEAGSVGFTQQQTLASEHLLHVLKDAAMSLRREIRGTLHVCLAPSQRCKPFYSVQHI